MTLFIWIDENGNWRVTHLPPKGERAVLQVMIAGGDSIPIFMDPSEGVEVPIGVNN